MQDHPSAESQFLRRHTFKDHKAILARRETDRLQAVARDVVATKDDIAAPPAEDRVRRAAHIWRRCPERVLDHEPSHPKLNPRVATTWNVRAWTATVEHFRQLGYDVRDVVPDSARRAWHRQRCRCCAHTDDRTMW